MFARMLGDSSNLQLVFAAAQAVHQDVATGRSLAQAQADLDRAKGFLAAIAGTPEYDQGSAAVASAQRDFDNLASHQGGAQSAASDFQASTSANQQFFQAGGKDLDVGGGDGSEVADAFGWTDSMSIFTKDPVGFIKSKLPTIPDIRDLLPKVPDLDWKPIAALAAAGVVGLVVLSRRR